MNNKKAAMKIYKKDKTVYIVPNCDLVASNVEKIRDSVLMKLKKESSIEHLVLNVNGIEVVDSLGVNLIIGIYREAASQSMDFQVTNANEKFQKISGFFKFEDFFKVSSGSKTK